MVLSFDFRPLRIQRPRNARAHYILAINLMANDMLLCIEEVARHNFNVVHINASL